ncbi:MAG: NifU family protein [Deltaproteobacteria bacterium]|nr:NifU family protein [Deltaproteobacteria bacterium]
MDKLRGREDGDCPADDLPTAHASGAQLGLEEVSEALEAVRPALQRDGGDIQLHKVEDNDVYVSLVGACAGCPSATITLRLGVERHLKEVFPSMGRVIQVGGPFGT